MLSRHPALFIFPIALGAGLPLFAEDRPPLEKLVELNQEKLFGGEAHLEAGDHIKIHFNKPGMFQKGFVGTGMENPEQIKGDANRKILENPEGGGAIPAQSVVGRGNGEWVSRFELSGRVHVTFKLRIPNFQRGSDLAIWLNRGSKSFLQTDFFQTASILAGGKTRKAAAGKEYQGPPEKWYDKKKLAPVDLLVDGGKFSVKFHGKDLVTLDGADDAPSGKIAFTFQKLSFVVSDLSISGKIDRAWCEAQIKDLETKGLLVTKEPAAPAAPAAQAPAPRKGLRRDENDKATREKEAKEDL